MLTFARGSSGIQLLIIGLSFVFVLIFSLTLHEFAHAYAAYKSGDDTAKMEGRLTLNPLSHIDLIGFVTCLLFGFGWAKPVPVNPFKFRNYKKGMFFVSMAGVIMNLILALIFCPLFLLCEKYFLSGSITNFQLFLYSLTQFAYQLNICLFVFNLLPIAPLDGFNLLQGLCSYDNKFIVFMRKNGYLVLIAMLIIFRFTNIFESIIYGLTYPIEALWKLII